MAKRSSKQDDRRLRDSVATALSRFGFGPECSWARSPELIATVVKIVEADRRRRPAGKAMRE